MTHRAIFSYAYFFFTPFKRALAVTRQALRGSQYDKVHFNYRPQITIEIISLPSSHFLKSIHSPLFKRQLGNLSSSKNSRENDFSPQPMTPPISVLGLGKETTSHTWESHVGGNLTSVDKISVWGELECACFANSMT